VLQSLAKRCKEDVALWEIADAHGIQCWGPARMDQCHAARYATGKQEAVFLKLDVGLISKFFWVGKQEALVLFQPEAVCSLPMQPLAKVEFWGKLLCGESEPSEPTALQQFRFCGKPR